MIDQEEVKHLRYLIRQRRYRVKLDDMLKKQDEKDLEIQENVFMSKVKMFKTLGYGKKRIYQFVDVAFDNIVTIDKYSEDSK